MTQPNLRDLPQLQEWDHHPSNIQLGTLHSLHRVYTGQLSGARYRLRINTALAGTHILTNTMLDKKDQPSSLYITYADLEGVDHQYLLCGMNDGGIAIYDTQTLTEGKCYSKVSSVRGGHRGAHKHAVEIAQWYPADTGLFTTSSFDSRIKVWDPNRMTPVDQFKLPCQVRHHHMSPVATRHSLLAAAGENGQVFLCDLRTGSSTHNLNGHEGPVQYTQWAPYHQHHLATGGRDYTIRIWDVRASRSCLMILDQENTPPDEARVKKRMKKTTCAHTSRITSLCYTNDGQWLISFSYNGNIKLWNSNTGKNMMVNYGDISTDLKRNVKLSVSYMTYPDLVFVPSDSKILVFDIMSGRLINVLRGHFTSVLGAIYNRRNMDLYTFGQDRNFLTWTPKKLLTSNEPEKEEEEEAMKQTTTIPSIRYRTATQDAWSDDD